MKVVQIVSSFSHSAGGLFVSVSHLVRSSVAEGENVFVLGPAGDESVDDLSSWEPARVERFPRYGTRKFGYARGLVNGLASLAPDVVHAHGLWTYPSIAAARWSRRSGKPFMISVHGMVEPWALGQSPWKKRLGRALFQDRAVSHAACLRATSKMEIDSIRKAQFTNPVALVPNGVDIPVAPSIDLRGMERPRRKALFMSRLHPKKGVLNLVEAWRRLAPQEWDLVIVGPDEGGYEAKIRAAIEAAGLSKSITLPGPSWGDGRFRHYWEADLFILPSFSENFGLVIAEALACEVPVITTKGLPWEELRTKGCGWWIETGVEPLVAAIQEAIALSDGRRREMGSLGRELIARNYSWKAAGELLSEVYCWMVGTQSLPSCVQCI